MTAGEYAGISFGIVLILVVAFMTITFLCIPKIVVKTTPKDIQEIIAKRPDSPLWKNVIGIASAVAIIACILGIFVWVGWDAVQHGIGIGLQLLKSQVVKICVFILLSAVLAAIVVRL